MNWCTAASVWAMTLCCAASVAQGADAGGDVTGTWWANLYSPSMQSYLVGGGDIPLNEAGKQKYAENQAGLRDGSLSDRARKFCTPDGLPRALATPYPFQIVDAPAGHMTIVYEQNQMIRGVAMDKPLESDDKLAILPFWNGHSAGNWDGDTLVIQTAGFNENTFADATGLPHSDQLKITERLRPINGGAQLEDVATVHDPVYYSQDWQVRFVYDRKEGLRMMDYICGETHRDISGIKGINEARAANTVRAQPR